MSRPSQVDPVPRIELTRERTLARRLARVDLRPHLPLILILLAAAALRLQYIDLPLLDAHRWRQVDTAQIARSFYEDRFDIFKPQVNWGGAEGYVESEFPLLPALVAAQYFVFGPDEMLGRLTVVLFSLASIWLLYLLGRDFLGRSGGLAAAAVMAASPAAVFYGRAFMPDTLMVCFSLAALVGFVRYAQRGGNAPLVVGGISLALAILVKLPGVIVLLPVVGALWTGWGRAVLRDKRVWLAVGIPLAVAALWYAHAFQIYRETGLTFGVFGTTKTYPPGVASGPWTTAFSKWSTADLLTSGNFYTTLLSRLSFLLLPPAGLALSAFGFLLWRRHGWRWVPDAWLAAMTAFIAGAGWGHLGHDYYQLPLVPILALYFAAVARPAFDREWIRRTLGAGPLPMVAAGAVVVAVGWLGIKQSGVIERHFRPDDLDVRMLRAGEMVAGATGPGDLVVVVDDYGVNSPMLLYFAHRKGWSFDTDTATAPTVHGLRAQGAAFFATTRWSHLQRKQRDLVSFLETRRRVPLSNAPADMAIFDLRAPASRQPVGP